MRANKWKYARRWKRVIPALRRKIAYHKKQFTNLTILEDGLLSGSIERQLDGPLGWKCKYDWFVGHLLWKQQVPAIDIADILGCSRKQVYAAGERYGWKRRADQRRSYY